VAVDSDVDCERVDIVSKTFHNVTALSRLTYRHGRYGGWDERIVRPPRATESKVRHNGNLKLKNRFSALNRLQITEQIKVNSTNNCEF